VGLIHIYLYLCA